MRDDRGGERVVRSAVSVQRFPRKLGTASRQRSTSNIQVDVCAFGGWIWEARVGRGSGCGCLGRRWRRRMGAKPVDTGKYHPQCAVRHTGASPCISRHEMVRQSRDWRTSPAERREGGGRLSFLSYPPSSSCLPSRTRRLLLP